MIIFRIKFNKREFLYILEELILANLKTTLKIFINRFFQIIKLWKKIKRKAIVVILLFVN